MFTPAAQNLHQWSECHAMSFGQNDVWTNPVNDATRRSRGGAGVRTPAPWKITSSIGLYRNMQLDPSPWEKLDPLEMLDRSPPWNIGKLWFNDSCL